jgi:hypothetical protein
MPCCLSILKNNYENLSSMPHYLSLLKIILKIHENHLKPHHLSPLKNNSEHSRNMSPHLMPRHISPVKNNSKNSRKSPHPMTHFSMPHVSMTRHLMSRHISPLINNSENSKKYIFLN